MHLFLAVFFSALPSPWGKTELYCFHVVLFESNIVSFGTSFICSYLICVVTLLQYGRCDGNCV